MAATINRQTAFSISLALRITQICFAIIELGLSGYTLFDPLYLNTYYTCQALALGVACLSVVEGAFLLGMFQFWPPILALVCEIVMSILSIASFGYYAGYWGPSGGNVIDGYGDVYFWFAWPIIQAAWAFTFLLFLIHLVDMILIVVFVMIPLQGSPLLGKTRTLAIGSIFPAEGIVGQHEPRVNDDYEAAQVYQEKESSVGVQTVPITQHHVAPQNNQIVEPPVVIGNNQPPPSNVYPPPVHS